MWDVIDGVVSDEIAEGETLDPLYQWAKFKISIFNYRKLFGLTFKEAMEEDFDEFLLNDKINELIYTKKQMENT